ncbi:hypothetical protein Cpha266_1586 [Chlorobium phaeobacteroides DSM 266]|jgi:uncharacterized protein (TIGR02145 family)|uniref:Fibrobacter succinogenes major paralogous domain-containing protein n=2 Tax=Chlorobium phaeobacteroides TaxID=1096 RepID=A1BGT1_CHLPD|nr:hypothetical protein Cpha266_1586 [Chlorobium phaeobacteroides DSM 266]
MELRHKRLIMPGLLKTALLLFLTVLITGCSALNNTDQHAEYQIYGKSNGDYDGSTGKMDYQGYTYKVVRIGALWWMAENLRCTKYNDGSAIQEVTDNSAWKSSSIGALCDYGNNPANGNVYGKLYNWHSVKTGKLHPPGWHIPGDKEWTALTDHLKGISVAGGKLKETGIEHWEAMNVGATNESGFTALGGGNRNETGAFDFIRKYSYFWSASEKDDNSAWARKLGYYGTEVLRYNYSRNCGFSVRCVRN